MAVDQYALCPCGSGKKIKFCKCFDSIGEMDKVIKMVSGGQKVAAIDRLNQLLQQHPGAAWALAIKGRLLISLNELDALSENADRFIRLQPSNPLALAQKAAAHVFKNQPTEAAHSILEALAESGRGVDAFLLEISTILAVALARRHALFSARLYATLPLMNRGFEDPSVAESVLSDLNRNRGINLLMKSLPVSIARPDDVSWAERFDEAQSLLYNHQILAAEAKLEALDRQFSNQPAILSGLLSCAIWRADTDAQVRLLRKLSEVTADPEQSARLLAQSFLADPDETALLFDAEAPVYEMQDVDQAIIALTGNPLCRGIPHEALQQSARESGEVPPRAAFELLDRPLPGAGETLSADNVPQRDATLVLYGRQTDRAPRLEVLDMAADSRERVMQALQGVVDTNNPLDTITVKSHFGAQFFPNMVLPDNVPTGDPNLIAEVLRRRTPEIVLNTALPATDGRPLRLLMDDPSTQRVRTALMRIVQGIDLLAMELGAVLDDVCRVVGVEPVPTLRPNRDDQIEELSAFDLCRVDVSGLDPEGLYFLFQRANQIGTSATLRAAAERIVGMDAEDDQAREMHLQASLVLMQLSRTPEEALEISARAKQWCAERKIPDASFLLNDLYRHVERGDADAFHRTVQTITTKYANQQTVIMHLQRVLVNLGLLNPDGSPRSTARPPADSGLWTGGPAAPAAPTPMPAPASSAQGTSKLWLPGMD